MINITPKEFKQLAALIEDQYGIHLKEEKSTLLTGRLHKVLADLEMKTFTEYYQYLIADKSGTALATLVNKVSTNHTYFMREAEHFDYFYHVVLPYLKTHVRDKDIRIWCAASSSGEEPYTLAMLTRDFFEDDLGGRDIKILATDISDQALTLAKRGIYTKEQIEPMPKKWQDKYFKKTATNEYAVIDIIKNEVLFRKFNLMEDVFPWRKKLHVIFCRNVMIYFDTPTKDKVIMKMFNSLDDGGYFFIGHSESVNRAVVPFTYLKPAIYRKMNHQSR